MMNPNDYKLTGTYYLDVSDMEKHEGKIPNYDYSKNGKCNIHGAFNNHYRRNCPKCMNDEADEAGDNKAELLRDVEREEARAINATLNDVRF